MFGFRRTAVAVPLIAIGIGCCLIQPINAFAVPQDAVLGADPVTVDRTEERPAEQYLITVSEYSMKGVDFSGMTADQILAAIKTKKLAPVETIMLSAIEGAQSRASFGRRVAVTTGFSTNRNGKSRNTEYRDLGTVLNVTPTTEGQQVESSR